MTNKFYFIYEIINVKLFISEDNGFINKIKFSVNKPEGEYFESPLIKETFKQISEYIRKERKSFDIPISVEGTVFQKKVWAALLTIPYGETCTYKYIAEKIGCPKGFRAVGLANNKNPISIIVPCHRVIGQNNKLVGYAGGLETKKFLLELEKSTFI